MDYKKICIDFAEGRMVFEEFYDLVMKNPEFEKWIDVNGAATTHSYTKATKENNWTSEEIPFSIRHEFELCGNSVMSIGSKLDHRDLVVRLLEDKFPDCKIVPDQTYSVQYDLLLDACPDYIDGPEIWESGIIDNIINECPVDWSKSKKKRYVKDRIKEVFHLEPRKYPRWFQNPDWPVANGRPMKFVETTTKRKYEWYQHRFVDVETGEERVIDDLD